MEIKTLLPALSLLTFACAAPSASVVPRAGYFEVQGDFSASSGAANASSDFDSLGLGDQESGFSPRIDLDFAGLQLSVSSLSTGFAGDGTVEGDIDLGGQTITGGTDVESDFAFDAFSTVLTWDVVPTSLVDVGIGIGVSLLQFDMAIEEKSGPMEVSTDETVPVPMLAGRVGSQFGDFGLSATLGVLEVSLDEADAAVFDVDIAAEYHFLGGRRHASGRFVLGYRAFDFDVEYEDTSSDVDTDFTIDGPYIGVSISI